jgi:hypothetical protein
LRALSRWPATISRFFRRLFRQKSSAHGYVMLLTKFSPPQPARLKCLNQLLRFCTAPPLLLNSPIAFFLSSLDFSTTHAWKIDAFL